MDTENLMFAVDCSGCGVTVGWVTQEGSDGPLSFAPARTVAVTEAFDVREHGHPITRAGIAVDCSRCGAQFRIRGVGRVPGEKPLM
jgi:hypothetical protein